MRKATPPSNLQMTKKSSSLERLKSRRKRTPKPELKTWRFGTKRLPQTELLWSVSSTQISISLRRETTLQCTTPTHEMQSVWRCRLPALESNSLVTSVPKTCMNSSTRRKKCSKPSLHSTQFKKKSRTSKIVKISEQLPLTCQPKN